MVCGKPESGAWFHQLRLRGVFGFSNRVLNCYVTVVPVQTGEHHAISHVANIPPPNLLEEGFVCFKRVVREAARFEAAGQHIDVVLDCYTKERFTDATIEVTVTHWDSCTARRIVLPEDLASVAWGEFIHAVGTAFDADEYWYPANFAVCLVNEQCFDILTVAGRQLMSSLRDLRVALQELRQSEGVHDCPEGTRRLYIFTLDYSTPCLLRSLSMGLRLSSAWIAPPWRS